MVIVFEKRIRERLAEIERAEGIPEVEFVRQAVEVWSQADATMRQSLGLMVMRAKLQELRK